MTIVSSVGGEASGLLGGTGVSAQGEPPEHEVLLLGCLLFRAPHHLSTLAQEHDVGDRERME